ncbi:MAG: methyltransferase domain-containing protein [Methanocalculus sp. MSAO_Arc1]|uniref:class I SAM-dependent methyltransferase n=1 Tax=Methanocalculus TaxID=71151 RepID=UPI000FF09ADD|nr:MULTISPECIES: methyltransferase domain-containing protein [unclassified Methanocalculus]MCP1661844.1 ubiquinone/menaquinone biosynthesis C-methylase UbiE [Methanocalculus sp. AMF5]RQD81976.1 MAG: methyltransferase domain-containing protein [Methanocalculus sp. MSAO_Arc1]
MSRTKVQAHYDEVADVYDQRYDLRQGRLYHHHLSGIILDRVLDHGTLLDLGCGTGLFIEHYTAAGGDAVGLDISPGMVGIGKVRCPDAEYIVGTADILPFEDESFDSVASLLAFTYLPDPEAMLRESYRILKPGGSIAVVTLGRNMMTWMVPFFYRLGERIGYRKIGVGDFGEHYYSEKEMVEMFKRAGFTEVSSTRCSFAHYTLSPRIFAFAQQVEGFVERRLPVFAFNVCVSGKKEGGDLSKK